jgi:flagellar M-ring protein FliF
LVDADGRVSMKAHSKDPEAGDLEQGMEAKLVAMLEPLAGRDNVRATVNVSYDESVEVRTDEVYDPTRVAALSMQKSDQTAAQAAKAEGVPGTASNSPAGAAAGSVAGSKAAAAPGIPPLLQKEALPVYPQSGGMGQTLHQENGAFAVTKHMTHTELGPGRIRRISTAVVVNDRSSMSPDLKPGDGKAGQLIWKPRSAEEMKRLEQLAQAAVGFDAQRGDQVVMQNISFSSNVPETRPAGVDRFAEEARSLLHSQPSLMRTLMVGLCGVLLVLFVLKPIAQQVKATLKEPLLLATGVPFGRHTLSMDGEPVSAPVSRESEKIEGSVGLETSAAALRQAGIFEHVSEHIRREPIQSTRLLETWIASDEVGSN